MCFIERLNMWFLFRCVLTIIAVYLISNFKHVYAQPIPGSNEDFVVGLVSPSPTPINTIPTPAPTPLPPGCPAGTTLWTAPDGREICIPPYCISDPRYALFINSCQTGSGQYPTCQCSDACVVAPVYEMTINRLQSRFGINKLRSLADGSYPKCLRRVAAQCGNRWSTEVNIMGTGSVGSRRAIYQDLYGIRESSLVRGSTYEWGYLPNSQQVTIYRYRHPFGLDSKVYYFDRDRIVENKLDYGTDECVVNKIGGYNSVASMNVILDSNCKPISEPPYTCGLKGNVYHDSFWGIGAVSPVSLIFDPRNKIGDAVNVVQFPLNPNKKDKWYAWKASSVTPLVVIDPKHEGNITSATQLFGNYTFGKSWKHGFEALATLDLNHDGKVAGEELKDLGLWFDKNQDGISQPGEVEDMRAVGISALYFKPNDQSTHGADIFIRHGFDRTVEGNTVKGAAVDWFVAEYQSRTEGLIKEQARTVEETASEDKQTEIPLAKASLQNPDSSGDSTIRPSFRGAWTWKTAESTINGEVMELGKSETAPMGLLTFEEKDGKITGHSFIEIEKPANSASIRSEVVIFSLNGTTTIGQEGTPKVSFSVKHDNGLETRSTAELSSDGRWLLGQSSMEIGHQHDGRPIVVDYIWKGERVE